MIAAIMAVLQAIAAFPKIKAIFDEIAALWVQKELAQMRAENRDAIRKALNEKDQRDLEKVLGNPNPGEVSHNPGASVVDPDFLRK